MAILDLPGPSYLCLYQYPGDVLSRPPEEMPKVLTNWRVDDLIAIRESLWRGG